MSAPPPRNTTPTIGLALPEWPVGHFIYFAPRSFSFKPVQRRELAGVHGHLDKARRLLHLAERLRPNLRIDDAFARQHGFTSGANQIELAAVLETVVVELYSALDCCAKVLRTLFEAGTSGFRESTSRLFNDPYRIKPRVPRQGLGPLPESIQAFLVEAKPLERELRGLRDELVHRSPGDLSIDPVSGRIDYFHLGKDDQGGRLEKADIFAWLQASMHGVDAFLRAVFTVLNGYLKDIPENAMCGFSDGKPLLRYIRPGQPLTRDSGSCAVRDLLDDPARHHTCPWQAGCRAYRHPVDRDQVEAALARNGEAAAGLVAE